MKKKVLIIEDNKKNRLLEKDLLEVAGFEVLEAEDGVTGIALAGKEKPDAIVMDFRLPDMRGTEVARSLRQDVETRNIPIIFVTASMVGPSNVEIQSITNTFFLAKPIDTRSFAKTIHQSISGDLHE